MHAFTVVVLFYFINLVMAVDRVQQEKISVTG
jgi:hypothetical protein